VKLVAHHDAQQQLPGGWQAASVTNHFQLNNRFHDPYNEGCYDEFYFIAALYGYMQNVNAIELNGVGVGGGLNQVGMPNAAGTNASLMYGLVDQTKFNDKCHTFAAWSNMAQIP